MRGVNSVNRGSRFFILKFSIGTLNSYYAQVADDAMMGDRDAMDEMRGEFGDGEW